MRFSKIIRKDESAETEVWEFPFIGDGDEIEIPREEVINVGPTAEEIEAIQEQAYNEAFQKAFEEGQAAGYEEGKNAGYAEGLEQGRQDGLQQGQAIVDEKAQHLDALLETLGQPFLELDHEVEQQLASLAMTVARHVVRREIKTDPNQIIGVVRKAVSVLPISARNVRVYLHPEDAAIVREGLSMGEGDDEERRWKIVEDPALSVGGCNIETDQSRIDATVESRLAAVIAQVMGGGRETDVDDRSTEIGGDSETGGQPEAEDPAADPES